MSSVGCVRVFVCFFVCLFVCLFVLVKVLLKCNSQTIFFAHLNYTIQLFLIKNATTTTVSFRTFSSLLKKPCTLSYYSFLFSSFPSNLQFSSVQFSSVSQSCLTLCDPMNHSMPGLANHHQLPEFTQTHVHRVGDAIQPSHPLSSPSPPAPNLSQHQSLCQ